MSKKTLLSLAASLYQLDTIRTAKRLGYRVITTDNVPLNPGHALADRAYQVDTTDHEAVLRIAEIERIHGVIAACTDVAVPTAAYIAEKLGLPGPSYRSALALCDKAVFRKLLAEYKFPSPRAVILNADTSIPEDLFEAGCWILKPDRSSGSKGIYIIQGPEQLAARLPETLAFSPTGTAVLEEFIDGHQGTCEGIVRNNRIVRAFFLDRQTAPRPYVATHGHHVPTLLSQRFQIRVSTLLERLFEVVNVRDGPFDCDFVATTAEVFLLEVTPRVGGNSISSLLRKATGFDLIEYAVRQACGETSTLPDSLDLRPSAVVLLGVMEAGRLRYDMREVNRLRLEPWVESLDFEVGWGEPVWPFINGRHRIGEAFVWAHDRAALDARVTELKERLQLRAA